MGTGSLSRSLKRPGRGVDHPPASSVKVKEKNRTTPPVLHPCAFLAVYRVNLMIASRTLPLTDIVQRPPEMFHRGLGVSDRHMRQNTRVRLSFVPYIRFMYRYLLLIFQEIKKQGGPFLISPMYAHCACFFLYPNSTWRRIASWNPSKGDFTCPLGRSV